MHACKFLAFRPTLANASQGNSFSTSEDVTVFVSIILGIGIISQHTEINYKRIV